MAGNSYKVITTVRNTPEHLDRCLASIAAQEGDYDVCVVDDASTDNTPQVAAEWCEREGWTFIAQTERKGALWNQVQAIRTICSDPDEVICWVDGDDRLARTDTFAILDRAYEAGAMLTYGSYEPDPPSATCAPAIPFRRSVIRQNAYRRCAAPHSWNHLRTMRFGLFDQLTEDDFTDADGNWWTSTPDAVVMFPCLELARGAVTFIPETLIYYTSDLASAEWRDHPERVNAVNRYVLAQPPKC